MYEELVKRLRVHNGWALNDTLDEAADAIEELSREAEFNAKRAIWIPVTERLPKDDTICILTDGVSEAIGYRGKVFGWHLIWTDYLAESDITHWMPLPEPPKEGET